MKKIEIDHFLNYTFLNSLESSPHGKILSFVVSEARYEQNDYAHQLFLSDGTKHKRVLNLKNDARYFWETENTILYFSEKTSGDKRLKDQKYTVVYRYHIDTKKSSLAFTLRLPISKIEIINRTTLLLHASLNAEEYAFFEPADKRLEFIQEEDKNKLYDTFDSIPFQSNGKGFTKGRHDKAFLYNIVSEEFTPLQEENEAISNVQFNSNTKTIYYTKNTITGVPVFFSKVYAYDFKTSTETCIYDQENLRIKTIIPINNELFLFASDLKKSGINQNPHFYELKDNKVKIKVNFGKSSSNSIGSDVRFGTLTQERITNNQYYFLGTSNDRSVLYSFDGQNITTVLSKQGSMDTFTFRESQLYAIGLYNNSLQDLYWCDPKANKVNKVSTFNANSLLDKDTITPLHHTYKNGDTVLDGWVLLPKNYDKEKSYPSILDIHGGPKTIYSDVYYHEMQVFANEGYIVYFTNPRGGDAYDDAFADIRGKYGTIDYEDIMTFVDYVQEHYSLDKDRMGVTGGSYGGFMTNWIVSHTNRFKAAATQRSISNWLSFYGTSDIGTYFGPDQTGGDPFNDFNKVWEQSPLKHARNIQTPLLFLHSDEDYRCPIEQAYQLFTVVKMNGVDTRFINFKGENHDLSRSGKPQARIKRLEEIVAWFNRHLKD